MLKLICGDILKVLKQLLLFKTWKKLEENEWKIEYLIPSAYSDGSHHSSCADHIFEKVNPEMEKLGYECKCLGGGKIDHNSKDKKIRVFGLSTGYGKADHSVTVEILKKVYTDYEITWSDDKK
ncbi:14 kDa phosphohistidine phosphatase [Manacus vitellinus]|uniref:14 kDa phosphohistidine phosphatase n=1 Tax=Manacus vitellinus TaxID=328815 RepID=UPI00115CC2FA|nr:14 kDa phosphohistidine phosphatase [Manacus vitellinus]